MMHPTCDSWLRGAALALALAALPAVAHAQAADQVKLADKSLVSGEIIAVSPIDVEIKDQRTDEPRKVPIDQIVSVAFAGEPDALRIARNLLLRQDPAGALEQLAKMEPAELEGASANVVADVAFVKAAAVGRQAALTGADQANAEKGLRDFIAKHPRSHHFFRMHEILGDLLVRAGKFDEAAKANSFYEQKKYAEAEKEYGVAAQTPTDSKDEASARQKREALAGRARCLTRQGKAAEAVKIMQDVIRAADPEDKDSLAPAYVVLGDAHRAANADQDALIAFLTVDLVYNSLPESHAEALYNLAQLWQKAQNPERSREAKQTLEATYPDSRWTKALAAGGNG